MKQLHGSSAVIGLVAGGVLVAMLGAARDPAAPRLTATFADSLEAAEMALSGRSGELELARLELSRLQAVLHWSAHYRIPADLAAAIHDIAVSEGVEPELAFSLVRVESGFTADAVSTAGAVGLTQVMPSTARWLVPDLAPDELFERDTNLRLGFRYLRLMLRQYDGDLRLALLAYNRGPGTVDSILGMNGDPANGYARAVAGQAISPDSAR